MSTASGISFADLVSRNGARDELGPRGRLRAQHKAALATHLASSACAPLSERYMCITGTQELPITCNENQPFSTEYSKLIMKEVCDDFFAALADRDAALADGGNARMQIMAQKKWLIPHDGSVGERADRKRVSEAIVRRVICAYYHGLGATELAAFFDRTEQAGKNCHDMCDALTQAMEEALRTYARFVKLVLPRRRPGEQRSDTPVLTREQMSNGGTIRVVGFDPGTTNAGLCLLEFGGMTQRADGEEPVPIFRILALQLVNLNLSVGHAVRCYPTPGAPAGHWLRPLPLEAGGGDTLEARAAAILSDIGALKVRKPRARKRPAAGGNDERDDAVVPTATPQKKRRKKAAVNVADVFFPEDH